MCDYLKQFPGASDIKRRLEQAADTLAAHYHQNHHPDWVWFEEALSYDNAVLPHALFVAGQALEDPAYTEVAAETTDFLLEATLDGDHFSFVGSRGWYERGRTRARFDQQPVEAAAMVMMLRTAYEVTKDSRFLSLQRTTFDWFLGTNDLGIPLYDFRTKGCLDGLMPSGVNGNQGAESTVSFLLSLLAIIESCAIIEGTGTPNAREGTWEGPQMRSTTLESPDPAPHAKFCVEDVDKIHTQVGPEITDYELGIADCQGKKRGQGDPKRDASRLGTGNALAASAEEGAAERRIGETT
jgi:hypothetical protein